MASDKSYLDYVLEQLSYLDDISYRAMMGEYILYYRGKIFGGIYDNRLMVKPVPSALNYVNEIIMEKPYETGHEMILVDEVDDREYLTGLVSAMYNELPDAKTKKK